MEGFTILSGYIVEYRGESIDVAGNKRSGHTVIGNRVSDIKKDRRGKKTADDHAACRNLRHAEKQTPSLFNELLQIRLLEKRGGFEIRPRIRTGFIGPRGRRGDGY
nr:hypothetical protein [Paenibacillus sp. UNC496MF]